MTTEATKPEATIELETLPKARKKRDKRDWTGYDSIHAHLRPDTLNQLNARAKLGRLAQSDVIETALGQYLKVQPTVEEELQRIFEVAAALSFI